MIPVKIPERWLQIWAPDARLDAVGHDYMAVRSRFLQPWLH